MDSAEGRASARWSLARAPSRLVIVALGTESALMVMAWAGGRLLGVPPEWGEPLRDGAIGLCAAGVLALLNYGLLVLAPAGWLVNDVRAVYADVLVPLFGRLNVSSVILIGAVAGVGEEWLFRGLLQPVVGIVAASAIFGIVHVGGRGMWAFGVWAALMGGALGGLMMATGGLAAPVVAHGVYDILALLYIRRRGTEA
ncbi:MAG: lysostaphin resistance A-like protein [Acidobacteriota bacterium]